MRLLPDGRVAPATISDVTADHDSLDGECTPADTDIVDIRLQAAIAQISQGFAMFDADQNLVVCNDAFVRTFQLSVEVCRPGTSFWDILKHGCDKGFKPAADDISAAYLRDLISERKSWSSVAPTENGRMLSTIHEPLQDGGWVSIVEDVTEKQQRQQEEMARLREAEAQTMRFNAAVANMSQGLSMFDANRKLITCNDSFARLYSLPEELTRPGTDITDIMRHRASISMIETDATLESMLQFVDATATDHAAFKGVRTMQNGRVVMINHQPLIDGGWLSTHEDITNQHHNAEIIHFMARHDNLTGLPNRATFLETLADAERGIATGDRMAVLSIDLERFKDVNDAFGHPVGDAVLAAIGDRLRVEFEGRGVAGRLGGDDFAALVGPLSSDEDVLDLAESLIASLRRPLTIGDTTVFCDASIGIAMAPTHGREANQLIYCADLALSTAKSSENRGWCVFEPNMDRAQRRRLTIERGLHQALENDSLTLAYQPLIAFDTGRVSCCEALLRWECPALGTVSPAEFIPVAEETGLIREIGVKALESACMEAANWPCHVRVAVNVSPVQFRGDDLVEHVAHALMVSGLEPSRLELEITESLFLADDEHNLEMLHRLRELGVRFALDDFGTGYSSLAYMLRFPFDKVKIDRSIVSTVAEKPETATMISAIADLCRGLKMLTVAEGIETEEQMTMVAAHGCNEVQGYIFAPALPGTAIRELLRRKQIRTHEVPTALSA